MKNPVRCSLIAITVMLFAVSCTKKSNDGITPSFGSTGNPNPNPPTVTGNTTFTTPATENSSMNVGGLGWTNPTCGSTHSIQLKGISENVDVTLTFPIAIKSGTFLVSTTPTTVQCSMTVINAPNQPAGIVWYGRGGTVSVTTTSTSINARFENIQCTQQSFNFPVVSVSGQLGCSQ